MNATVESLPNCLAKLRVELPADRVRKERDEVTVEFQRHVRLPGYRPGKAPRQMVEARFARQIQEELVSKLVREALQEAIKEKNLDVLQVAGVQRAELGPDDVMRIEATALVQPEIVLPDYRNVPIELEHPVVGEELVNSWLERMREPHATFDPIEGRAAQMGDFAVLTYEGALEGAAFPSDAPEQLAGGRNAWIHLDESTLLPGFAAQIIGLSPGGEKSFSLPLPGDFPLGFLAGKSPEYHVTPPLDDELAAKIEPGATAASLRETVGKRLQELAGEEFERTKRRAVMAQLLAKASFELPESYIARETTSILREIVQENQARGISDEEIKAHQDEIVGAAQEGARERVRSNFLLLRIARAEKLTATDEDLTTVVLGMAHRYEIPVKKLIADLRKRGGLDDLREQILCRKALDLVAAGASVTPPAKAPAA
jgi:trigger factor